VTNIFSASRTLQAINPLTDSRWESFLDRHPRSSVFHTRSWLQALQRTYGYEPIAFTTSPSGVELDNAVVFCVVKSWLVRARLVSLPFSDHADPLLDDPADLPKLLQFLERGQEEGKWTSIELRPVNAGMLFADWADFKDGQNYALHLLDLRPNLDALFRALQKDSIQRKILRAKREGVTCDEGRSDLHLREFYRLTVLTRRRQQVPPPPLRWYRNIIDCLGANATIRLARKNNLAIAAILTLSHKQTSTYKYGCSDARYQNLGGSPFLIWNAIEQAKIAGHTQFDLGRSDVSNVGLMTFKSRFGTVQSNLTYKKFPERRNNRGDDNRKLKAAKRVFAILPDGLFVLAGKLLYPHIG
jgi:CelD/BcsL family acetyltransferase involved in cellulose biosynthesis